MQQSFFERHKDVLMAAVKASRERNYWSPYPEMPSGKVYGETAAAEAEAAFAASRNSRFALDQPADGVLTSDEVSPYTGEKLGIVYPRAGVETLIAQAQAAQRTWGRASVEERVGVCLEILHRLNRRSFEIAQAVMHTTGQAFMMAFQAGGPHAQDRGLEAVAYAYDEMSKIPGQVLWEKPQGKNEPIRLDKTFRIVPRGIGFVIGCSTFPTWNSYPGLFASMATGNAVIVKPHPTAILPLAITVRIAREVLSEAGFDPSVVQLAADTQDQPIARDLATHPAVAIIDFTGSSAFGEWLETHARQALVYTEKAGVNPVVIDSTDDFKGMCRNLGFTLSLYSGQMCTTSQNIFVPAGGIATDEGHKSFDEVAQGLATAIDKLLGDPERAAAILGAIQNPSTAERLEKAKEFGEVLLPSRAIESPQFPAARIRTPLLLKAKAGEAQNYCRELFGPIAFVIETENTAQSLEIAARTAREKGAITAALYSTDPAVLAEAQDAFGTAGAALSCNLTGGVYVNQSAAFSDFHMSGANPAGNACLTDSAFVASRFRVVAIRIPRAA